MVVQGNRPFQAGAGEGVAALELGGARNPELFGGQSGCLGADIQLLKRGQMQPVFQRSTNQFLPERIELCGGIGAVNRALITRKRGGLRLAAADV